MATVEVIITIRVSDADGPGISGDAELLVDECCYYGGELDSALSGAATALHDAYELVDARVAAAHPIFAVRSGGAVQ